MLIRSSMLLNDAFCLKRDQTTRSQGKHKKCNNMKTRNWQKAIFMFIYVHQLCPKSKELVKDIRSVVPQGLVEIRQLVRHVLNTSIFPR